MELPGVAPSDEDFLPRFEATVSGSSEAALFFPLGDELSVLPFGAASFEGAIASLSSPSKGSRIVAMSFCEPRSCLGWLSS